MNTNLKQPCIWRISSPFFVHCLCHACLKMYWQCHLPQSQSDSESEQLWEAGNDDCPLFWLHIGMLFLNRAMLQSHYDERHDHYLLVRTKLIIFIIRFIIYYARACSFYYRFGCVDWFAHNRYTIMTFLLCAVCHMLCRHAPDTVYVTELWASVANSGQAGNATHHKSERT